MVTTAWCIDVENEMFRLNSNLLQPVSNVTCDPSTHVTIALSAYIMNGG